MIRRLVVAVLTIGAAIIVTVSARQAATLQITLLGTGNPRPGLERFGPSILVEAGSRKVLIDAGRGSTQRLFQIAARETLSSLDALFLTHLHSDHTVGIPDLWLTSWVWPRPGAGPRAIQRGISFPRRTLSDK
jgi:ribonuclease Z